ncbi:hypothetical protein CLOM_g3228 [Closterium sp. NIES-68]|nr:hypothetical protein CLOM_g3228 [Closterium sp. NIES-68]GJP76375.1 hypothetical protein CLOP_g6830 [Closterium sp. NIES-67]
MWRPLIRAARLRPSAARADGRVNDGRLASLTGSFLLLDAEKLTDSRHCCNSPLLSQQHDSRGDVVGRSLNGERPIPREDLKVLDPTLKTYGQPNPVSPTLFESRSLRHQFFRTSAALGCSQGHVAVADWSRRFSTDAQKSSSKPGRGAKGSARAGEKEAEKTGDAGEAGEAGENDVILTSAHPKDLLGLQDNTLFELSEEHLQQFLPEGLPPSVEKEFEASKSRAILLRAATKDFIHKLQAARDHQSSSSDSSNLVEPSGSPEGQVKSSSPGSFLIRGLPGSGKTCLLLTAVLWARANGWLVFYLPKAREWTNGGLYYKHPESGGEVVGVQEGGEMEGGGGVGSGGRRKAVWDTPIQAQASLKAFLAAHQDILSSLPVQLPEPITLGEGPGTGLARGSQVVSPGSDWSLGDLVKYGADHSHAATSVVVRLREELDRVSSVPTMIAIDEFNAWFTFAGFFESTGDRSRRQIHGGEMRMVQAFRSLSPATPASPASSSPPIVAAAFSESIAVGRLPPVLPGVPKGVRLNVPRFTVDETLALLQYYQKSCKMGRVADSEEATIEAAVRAYMVTGGNAAQLRNVAHFL